MHSSLVILSDINILYVCRTTAAVTSLIMLTCSTFDCMLLAPPGSLDPGYVRLKANEVIKVLRLLIQHLTSYQIMAPCGRIGANTIVRVCNNEFPRMNE